MLELQLGTMTKKMEVQCWVLNRSMDIKVGADMKKALSESTGTRPEALADVARDDVLRSHFG